MLNPLSCGIHHKEIWDMTGYDSPNHHCFKANLTITELNPGKQYDIFDYNLTEHRIFVAIEESRFS